MTAPLISAPALRALLSSGTPVLVCDCRFDLAAPAAGLAGYLEGHVPGAQYLNLDHDLSAHGSQPAVCAGRHPLPTREAAVAHLASLGFANDLPVVAYDTTGGMYAARLWWMLRWVGHTAVQVLDGGLQAWQAAGGALQGGAVAARAPGRLSLRASAAQVLSYSEILQGLGHGQRLVVDARAPDRFRGENETLDPVGGHIPGAANRFFKDNLGAMGCFKPAEQLRSEWLQVMGTRQPADLVMQCGSGVTACHNALALEVAGLPGAALYAGSWSEWCRQVDAPMALGA
jgi:thiosulfate/3-mercaptopyruvate sulfurtransferase